MTALYLCITLLHIHPLLVPSLRAEMILLSSWVPSVLDFTWLPLFPHHFHSLVSKNSQNTLGLTTSRCGHKVLGVSTALCCLEIYMLPSSAEFTFQDFERHQIWMELCLEFFISLSYSLHNFFHFTGQTTVLKCVLLFIICIQ